MPSELFFDDSSQKRAAFVKYLIVGGAMGALIGIFLFIMNYQDSFQNNPLAFQITLISIIIILIGLYLINKMRFDII
jgi:hypothetical protein